MKKNQLVMMFFAICAVILSGCKKFPDSDQSIWAEGLWLVAWLPGLGAIACWIFAYIGSRSGSKQTIGLGMEAQKVEYEANIPIHKTPYFPWAAGLTIATIVIITTIYVTG